MAPLNHTALLVKSQGAPLTLGTRPTLKPSKGQLLVKLAAAALNPVDTYQAQMGLFVPSYPFVGGYDGAGIVEEIGEGVTDFAKGDRVLYTAATAALEMHTFQEYGLADSSLSAKVPPNITLEEASTIPLCLCVATIGFYGKSRKTHGGAGLVAPWVQDGRGKYRDQPIVVIGGSSCVGQNALQMAKLSGFSPIITTASPRNEGYCKAAGATHVIDYTKVPYGKAFAEAVASITTIPIKVIFDCIALEESQLACWSILAPSGTLLEVNPTPSKAIGENGYVDKDGRKVIGVFGSPFNDQLGDAQVGKSLFAALEGMLRDGDVKPSKVELLSDGLLGIADGLERLKLDRLEPSEGVKPRSDKVTGAKLVARLADTPQ